MGQLYLQRFEQWSAVNKDDFDKIWGAALETFAKSGNWGGVEKGVRHIKTYGTSWGGYALIEVDDPEAFARYQTHHYQNYAPMARITFEPLVDLDAVFAPVMGEMKAKSKR
jgi:hypothetical protein